MHFRPYDPLLSSMVLLNLVQRHAKKLFSATLHSSMVLLNHCVGCRLKRSRDFTFQYGSIKSRCKRILSSSHFCNAFLSTSFLSMNFMTMRHSNYN